MTDTDPLREALADALESRLTKDRNGHIDASLGIKVNSKLCEEVAAAVIALRTALPPAAPALDRAAVIAVLSKENPTMPPRNLDLTAEAIIAIASAPQPAAIETCSCGPLCQDLGKEGGCRYLPSAPLPADDMDEDN